MDVARSGYQFFFITVELIRRSVARALPLMQRA